MRSPLLLVLLARRPALAAALLAGCGGGSGSTESTAATTTATTAALSKAELIEQGDAICAEVNAAVGTVGSRAAPKPSSQVRQVGRPLQRHGRQPEEARDAAGNGRILANSSPPPKNLRGGGRSQTRSRARRHSGLAAAETNASAALASFQAAAQEYGFKECTEGPQRADHECRREAGGTGSAEAPEEPEAEAVAPEAEAEPAPEPAPETGGAGGATEGGGTAGGARRRRFDRRRNPAASAPAERRALRSGS